MTEFIKITFKHEKLNVYTRVKEEPNISSLVISLLEQYYKGELKLDAEANLEEEGAELDMLFDRYFGFLQTNYADVGDFIVTAGGEENAKARLKMTTDKIQTNHGYGEYVKLMTMFASRYPDYQRRLL